MGGHGGLNILPQKKWNVYNPDNREKVAKDERHRREREEEEEERIHNQDAERRYKILRERNISENESSNSEGELKEGKGHINFFENEEKSYLESRAKKSLLKREENKYKDKEYDETTKFMGNLGSTVPWYQKPSTEFEQKSKHSKRSKYNLMREIEDFEKEGSTYYKEITFSPKEKKSSSKKKSKKIKKCKKEKKWRESKSKRQEYESRIREERKREKKLIIE